MIVRVQIHRIVSVDVGFVVCHPDCGETVPLSLKAYLTSSPVLVMLSPFIFSITQALHTPFCFVLSALHIAVVKSKDGFLVTSLQPCASRSDSLSDGLAGFVALAENSTSFDDVSVICRGVLQPELAPVGVKTLDVAHTIASPAGIPSLQVITSPCTVCWFGNGLL